MNIGEIELKSGLERANVRFYEKEGFLTPTRRENGYRDYSQDDLDILLRIKLLRRLGLGLEEIKAIQNGEQEMDTVLQRRLGSIRTEHQELDAAETVCSQMRQEGARFESLDAQRYLCAYDAALRPADPNPGSVPDSDRMEPVRTPWRRYFAKMLDLTLTDLFWRLLLSGLLSVKLSDMNIWASIFLQIFGWLLLIPLEGFCLSRWGTTPGKWVMGLRLEHADGRLLTLDEAISRSLACFGRGGGYGMPVYSLYRLWQSYKDVTEGSGAEWDADTVFLARNYTWPRTAGYIALRLTAAAIALLIGFLPARPRHRTADLTVEQFVENYNRAARYFGLDNSLQTDGTFASPFPGVTNWNNAVVVIPSGDQNQDRLRLVFTEEQGILTGISFEGHSSSSIWGATMDAEGKNAVQLIVWAYAGADDGLLARYRGLRALDPILKMQVGHVDLELLGCKLSYTLEDTGDTMPEGTVFNRWNRTSRFSITKQ